jgi:hypothetical protein
MDWDAVYCSVDDFCKLFLRHSSRRVDDGKPHRNRSSQLSLSEMLTIMIGFHVTRFRDFKTYYLWLLADRRRDFPNLVSYQRFVEWMPSLVAPMAAYLTFRFGDDTGIAFVDSTALAMCGNKRISRNRVFHDIAQIGRTTIGWFFGFKLHLAINECGDLLGIRVTPGNVDDRKPVPGMCRRLCGKLFGDKGYLSKSLTAELMQHGLRLVTSLRKNMREQLLPLWDKLMLRKRSIIETVIDQLKNISQIEHTRHRSPTNCLLNILSGLVAYTHQPKRPSLQLSPEENQQLDALTTCQPLLA